MYAWIDLKACEKICVQACENISGMESCIPKLWDE